MSYAIIQFHPKDLTVQSKKNNVQCTDCILEYIVDQKMRLLFEKKFHLNATCNQKFSEPFRPVQEDE